MNLNFCYTILQLRIPQSSFELIFLLSSFLWSNFCDSSFGKYDSVDNLHLVARQMSLLFHTWFMLIIAVWPRVIWCSISGLHSLVWSICNPMTVNSCMHSISSLLIVILIFPFLIVIVSLISLPSVMLLIRCLRPLVSGRRIVSSAYWRIVDVPSSSLYSNFWFFTFQLSHDHFSIRLNKKGVRTQVCCIPLSVSPYGVWTVTSWFLYSDCTTWPDVLAPSPDF